jgi:hypothetical protein
MWTHTGGPLKRAPYTAGSQDSARAGAAAAYLAMIKRFSMCVLTVAGAGVAVAAIMALKVAIYLPRFIHR